MLSKLDVEPNILVTSTLAVLDELGDVVWNFGSPEATWKFLTVVSSRVTIV